MFNLRMVSQELRLERAAEADEIIKYVLSKRLSFHPGTSTQYSNAGYLILSKVIEKISGKEYEDFVKEAILYPAGVYDMHIANNLYEDRYPNEVKYYGTHNEEPIEPYDFSGGTAPRCYGGNNLRALSGAGAWVASPSELLKFVAAIDGRGGVTDILSAESIDIMTRYSEKELPIGWAKCTSSGVWVRSGNFSGTTALIKYNPNGLSWAFLANTSSWKGPQFSSYIDVMFRNIFSKSPELPDRDLFELVP